MPQPPSAYAERCKRAIRGTMPERLADELLVAAIIEARSSERMALLASALRGVDAEVSAFYADLVEAEARHQALTTLSAQRAARAPARAAHDTCAANPRLRVSLG